MSNESERHYTVGLSGASGAVYGVRLIEALLRDPLHRVHLTITGAGMRVLGDELDPMPVPARGPNERDGLGPVGDYLDLDDERRGRLKVYACGDIGAPMASGTFKTEAMIVVPCSMNTLASVAGGLQPNLLTRAAAVTLKEGRPLILVPRETPLGLVELRNMVAAREAGAVILPANPGFYHRPESIEDLVRFVVQKVMDRLGLDVPDPIRWSGKTPGRGERSASAKNRVQ